MLFFSSPGDARTNVQKINTNIEEAKELVSLLLKDY